MKNQTAKIIGETLASFGIPSDSDPKEALVTGKFMARAWAHIISSNDRVSAACTFIAEAISSYAAAVAAETGAEPAFSAPPSRLTTYALDESAGNLATTLGTAAARLEPLESGYLISVIYTAMLPDELRARHGIYYTPPALTRRLIAMATEAGVDWATCRVLDPACGGGAFLAPAALRIVEDLPDCEPAILLQNIGNRLRGFEIDPFAAWMAQAFLEIALAGVCRSAGRRLPRLVTVCDSLAQDPDGENFDLVMGNPPYGRMGLPPALRQRYRRSLYGHANQYGVFTDLALRWTAPGGVIAYVTPTSFLAGEYFKALRALLASEAPAGGWFPIAFAAAVFALMSTWRTGREALFQRLYRGAPSLPSFLASLARRPPVRVPGTAVFLTGNPDTVPRALLHNLKHNKVLHERVVVLKVQTEEVPQVPDSERAQVEHLGGNFHRVLLRYGFLEHPNVTAALLQCQLGAPEPSYMDTSFFLSRESLIPSERPDLQPWREQIFMQMTNTALDATRYFRLPPDRVVEIGSQVEI